MDEGFTHFIGDLFTISSSAIHMLVDVARRKGVGVTLPLIALTSVLPCRLVEGLYSVRFGRGLARCGNAGLARCDFVYGIACSTIGLVAKAVGPGIYYVALVWLPR